jgi:hypothetical protein
MRNLAVAFALLIAFSTWGQETATWTPDLSTTEGKLAFLQSVLHRHPDLIRSNLQFRRNFLETLDPIPGILEKLGKHGTSLTIGEVSRSSVRFTNGGSYEHDEAKIQELRNVILKSFESIPLESLSNPQRDIERIRELNRIKGNFNAKAFQKNLNSLLIALPFLYDASGKPHQKNLDSNGRATIRTQIETAPIDRLENYYTDVVDQHLLKQLEVIAQKEKFGKLLELIPRFRTNFIFKINSPLQSALKMIPKAGAEVQIRNLTLERMPGAVGVLRGPLGGDCSIISVPYHALINGVQVYAIRKSTGFTAHPAGYAFVAPAKVEEKVLPYVITINGSLSETDVRSALAMIQAEWKSERIVVPDFSKNTNVVNTDTMRSGMKFKNARAQKVELPEGWRTVDEITRTRAVTGYSNYYEAEPLENAFVADARQGANELTIKSVEAVNPYPKVQNLSRMRLLDRAILGAQALHERSQSAQEHRILQALEISKEQARAANKVISASHNQPLRGREFLDAKEALHISMADIADLDMLTAAHSLGKMHHENPELAKPQEWEAASTKVFRRLTVAIAEAEPNSDAANEGIKAQLALPTKYRPSDETILKDVVERLNDPKGRLDALGSLWRFRKHLSDGLVPVSEHLNDPDPLVRAKASYFFDEWDGEDLRIRKNLLSYLNELTDFDLMTMDHEHRKAVMKAAGHLGRRNPAWTEPLKLRTESALANLSKMAESARGEFIKDLAPLELRTEGAKTYVLQYLFETLEKQTPATSTVAQFLGVKESRIREIVNAYKARNYSTKEYFRDLRKALEEAGFSKKVAFKYTDPALYNTGRLGTNDALEGTRRKQTMAILKSILYREGLQSSPSKAEIDAVGEMVKYRSNQLIAPDFAQIINEALLSLQPHVADNVIDMFSKSNIAQVLTRETVEALWERVRQEIRKIKSTAPAQWNLTTFLTEELGKTVTFLAELAQYEPAQEQVLQRNVSSIIEESRKDRPEVREAVLKALPYTHPADESIRSIVVEHMVSARMHDAFDFKSDSHRSFMPPQWAEKMYGKTEERTNRYLATLGNILDAFFNVNRSWNDYYKTVAGTLKEFGISESAFFTPGREYLLRPGRLMTTDALSLQNREATLIAFEQELERNGRHSEKLRQSLIESFISKHYSTISSDLQFCAVFNKFFLKSTPDTLHFFSRWPSSKIVHLLDRESVKALIRWGASKDSKIAQGAHDLLSSQGKYIQQGRDLFLENELTKNMFSRAPGIEMIVSSKETARDLKEILANKHQLDVTSYEASIRSFASHSLNIRLDEGFFSRHRGALFEGYRRAPDLFRVDGGQRGVEMVQQILSTTKHHHEAMELMEKNAEVFAKNEGFKKFVARIIDPKNPNAKKQVAMLNIFLMHIRNNPKLSPLIESKAIEQIATKPAKSEARPEERAAVFATAAQLDRADPAFRNTMIAGIKKGDISSMMSAGQRWPDDIEIQKALIEQISNAKLAPSSRMMAAQTLAQMPKIDPTLRPLLTQAVEDAVNHNDAYFRNQAFAISQNHRVFTSAIKAAAQSRIYHLQKSHGIEAWNESAALFTLAVNLEKNASFNESLIELMTRSSDEKVREVAALGVYHRVSADVSILDSILPLLSNADPTQLGNITQALSNPKASTHPARKAFIREILERLGGADGLIRAKLYTALSNLDPGHSKLAQVPELLKGATDPFERQLYVTALANLSRSSHSSNLKAQDLVLAELHSSDPARRAGALWNMLEGGLTSGSFIIELSKELAREEHFYSPKIEEALKAVREPPQAAIFEIKNIADGESEVAKLRAERILERWTAAAPIAQEPKKQENRDVAVVIEVPSEQPAKIRSPEPWQAEFYQHYVGFALTLGTYESIKLIMEYQQGKVSKDEIIQRLVASFASVEALSQYYAFVKINGFSEARAAGLLKGMNFRPLAEAVLRGTLGFIATTELLNPSSAAIRELWNARSDGWSAEDFKRAGRVFSAVFQSTDQLKLAMNAIGFTVGMALTAAIPGLNVSQVPLLVGAAVGDAFSALSIPIRREIQHSTIEDRKNEFRLTLLALKMEKPEVLQDVRTRPLLGGELSETPKDLSGAIGRLQSAYLEKRAGDQESLAKSLSELYALGDGKISASLTRTFEDQTTFSRGHQGYVTRKIPESEKRSALRRRVEELRNEIRKREKSLSQSFRDEIAFYQSTVTGIDSIIRAAQAEYSSIFKGATWSDQVLSYLKAEKTMKSLRPLDQAIRLALFQQSSTAGKLSTFESTGLARVNETIALVNRNPKGTGLLVRDADHREARLKLLNDELGFEQGRYQLDSKKMSTEEVNWHLNFCEQALEKAKSSQLGAFQPAKTDSHAMYDPSTRVQRSKDQALAQLQTCRGTYKAKGLQSANERRLRSDILALQNQLVSDGKEITQLLSAQRRTRIVPMGVPTLAYQSLRVN